MMFFLLDYELMILIIYSNTGVIFATGLAFTGKKVFVNIYSTFLQRAYDQLIHDVAIQKAPVKFILDRAGIVGEDGKTHQGIFDLAYLLTVPNMTIIAPTTCKELKEAMEFAKNYELGPVAIRIAKGNCFDIDTKPDFDFGKWWTYKNQGKKLIVATGSMLEEVVKVEDELEDYTIVAAPFVKPLDFEFIKEKFGEYEEVITLEEGVKRGGFGSSILEFLNDNKINVNLKRLGLEEGFIPHGTRDQLMREYGLRGEKLLEAIKERS